MFCAISQFLDRNANHPEASSASHVTPPKKPFFSLPNLRPSLPDLLAREKAREKQSETTGSEDDAPKHNRRHLPIPSGRHTVGCVDIMCDVADHGTFFRLFYPTNKTDIHKHYKQWPLWLPRKQYVHGYMIFLKKNKIFGRLANLIGGDYHLPVIWLAPLLNSTDKFPVVIVTHGIGGNRTYLSTYCSELASHGFVVAAVEHRDGSASMTLCLQEQMSNIIKESNDETRDESNVFSFLLDEATDERLCQHDQHNEKLCQHCLRGKNLHTNHVNRTINSTNVINRTMNGINVISRTNMTSTSVIENNDARLSNSISSNMNSLDNISISSANLSETGSTNVSDTGSTNVSDTGSINVMDRTLSNNRSPANVIHRTLNNNLSLDVSSDSSFCEMGMEINTSNSRSSMGVEFYLSEGKETPESTGGRGARVRQRRNSKKRSLRHNHSCSEEWRPFEHVEKWDDFNYRNCQMYRRAEEISDLLDELTSMNEGNHINNALGLAFKTSQFKNRLDLSRVSAIGHSFGAAAMMATLATDDRFKVGISLDGWMLPVDRWVYSSPTAPVCFLNMEQFQWEQNVSRMMRFQEARETDRPMFTLMGGCHQSMSDFQFIVPQLVGRFFDMCYTLRPDLCIRVCVDTSLAFLYKHLNMPMESKHKEILACRHPHLISGTNVDMSVPNTGPVPP